MEKGKLKLSTARFDVYQIEVEDKHGGRKEKDYIVHPGAAVILPLLDSSTIIMIRNQRFAVGKELWELPAGTLEKNEEPIVTAGRELIEESGYKANRMVHLTTFFSSPGYCNEKMYAFVASELTQVGQALDETEKIKVEAVSWKDALQMASNGTIIDAKTLATLLYYHSFCRNVL